MGTGGHYCQSILLYQELVEKKHGPPAIFELPMTYRMIFFSDPRFETILTEPKGIESIVALAQTPSHYPYNDSILLTNNRKKVIQDERSLHDLSPWRRLLVVCLCRQLSTNALVIDKHQ